MCSEGIGQGYLREGMPPDSWQELWTQHWDVAEIPETRDCYAILGFFPYACMDLLPHLILHCPGESGGEKEALFVHGLSVEGHKVP